jgi:hypothetical protein
MRRSTDIEKSSRLRCTVLGAAVLDVFVARLAAVVVVLLLRLAELTRGLLLRVFVV